MREEEEEEKKEERKEKGVAACCSNELVGRRDGRQSHGQAWQRAELR